MKESQSPLAMKITLEEDEKENNKSHPTINSKIASDSNGTTSLLT